MKKLLLVTAVIGCVEAMAQGTVWFKNNVPGVFSAPVWLDGVTRLAGYPFCAQLYAGVDGSFTPIGVPTLFLANGFVSGGVVVVPANAIVGGVATLRMKAFELAPLCDGFPYEACPKGRYAFSESFTVNPTMPSEPPGLPAFLTNLKSFSLIIPEPSTIALGLVGAAVLLLRRK